MSDMIRWDVYVFLPGFPKAEKKTKRGNTMNANQKQHWNNKIFNPAIREVYDNFDHQYSPRSYETAKDRATARQKENVKKGNRAIIELHYFLDNEAMYGHRFPLDVLWEKIERKLKQQDNEAWHHVQLVAVSYGTKPYLNSRSISDPPDDPASAAPPLPRGLLDSLNETANPPPQSFVVR